MMADANSDFPSEDDLIELLAPHLLPYAPSGWHDLVPVARWLIKATSPRILVELGSHAGVSFSAFCEAMRRRAVVGKAFAVDTWRGDEHAGYYDDRVYNELQVFIDTNFKDFAQLMRMTFDDALGYFSDGTIDLLHIDGYHSYDAVRHDFEAWAPKMSEKSVVVLHDVNCRDPGFGVWRYWEELAARYPTFEFPHGSGLGLVALGSSPPPAIRALVELRDSDEIARLRRIFALAGRLHGLVYSERREAEEQLAALRSDREKVDADRQRIDAEARILAEELSAARRKLDEAGRAAEVERASLRREASEARAQRVAIEHEFAMLLDRHRAVTSSLPWRALHPLRVVRAKMMLNADRVSLLKRAVRPSGVDARRVLLSSLKRRASLLGTPRLPPPPPPPPLSNEEDRVLIDALVRDGELPSVCAVVVMGESSASRLEAIVAALDAQIARVRHIVVHVAPEAPSFAALDALTRVRPDVMAAVGVTTELDGIDAVLLISGTVTPKPEATAAMAAEMRATGAVFVYADEVFVDANGVASEPFHKPAYSPRLAATSDYIGGCALLALAGSVLPDAASLAEAAAAAGSVASFLTTTAARLAPGQVHLLAMPVIEETDALRAILPPPPPRHARLPRAAKAAIIIPTRNRVNLLAPCVESILEKTSASREAYEIIVVDNGSTERSTLAYLEEGRRLGKFKVLRDDGAFNYARLNNDAARSTSAEVLVFLNNDTLIIQSDWLARLVDVALEEGVGLVGAKLLYEDGTVQHGGVILGVQGVAAHADVNSLASAPGYHGLAQHDREVSAVTGACMACTRERFWRVGGFDESLAVAFNDTLLCINMLKAGLTNLQLNSVLVTHLESKSRGFDDTPAKRAKFFEECRRARSLGQDYFLDDIYYNPNLSLQDTYKAAPVPRRRKPWRAPRFKLMPRMLILSCTHQRGHGVPVVIERQVAHFLARGFEVHVGGPQTATDLIYEGCVRAVLHEPFEAAVYAVANDIDVILPHTPPFFSVARWTGPYPIVAPYDYGEPPPEMFNDAAARRQILAEKTFSLALSHRRYGISPSVKDESGFDDMIVVPLGNSHMARWEPVKIPDRHRVRAKRGWSDKVVVLNVCRFHAAERRYKGVDFFVEVAQAARGRGIDGASSLVFVQCGKAAPEDIAALSATGVECIANVSDEEMAELYCAADIYANFSQWEGWNLGIAQALAYGLPIVASDIPAHRKNFDVFTTSAPSNAAEEILRLARDVIAAEFAPPRKVLIDEWETRLTPYSDNLLELWRNWPLSRLARSASVDAGGEVN